MCGKLNLNLEIWLMTASAPCGAFIFKFYSWIPSLHDIRDLIISEVIQCAYFCTSFHDCTTRHFIDQQYSESVLSSGYSTPLHLLWYMKNAFFKFLKYHDTMAEWADSVTWLHSFGFGGDPGIFTLSTVQSYYNKILFLKHFPITAYIRMLCR